jgi:hypothetical protein
VVLESLAMARSTRVVVPKSGFERGVGWLVGSEKQESYA